LKLHSYAACIALTCISGCTVVAEGQVSQAASTKVIDWVNNNYFAYNEHINFANHPGPAQIPVPPEIDMPCHVCGDTAKTQGETAVDAWITKSVSPEMGIIKDLLAMERQITPMLGLEKQGELTPAAENALGKMSLDEMSDAIAKLANQLLYDKALPMGRKYDTEPKRAYAGIRLLSEVTSEQMRLIALKEPNANTHGDDETLALMATWLQSIANGIDKDIATGHRYNLCPGYVDIIREAQTLGGPEPVMQKVQAMIDRIDKLMHFNVQMHLHAQDAEDDGSHYDIAWSANAQLHLKTDLSKACYTPEFLDNGQMTVTVDSFSMVDSNGATIELTSPRSFQAPLGKPILNLCDPNPVLLIPFNAALMPKETLQGEGHTMPSMLFGSFLMVVIDPNNLNTQGTNELTGRNGRGPATPDNRGPDPGASAQMEKTKALLEAHQSDTAWLMSAEGQAALAKIQSEAMAMAQQQVAPLNTAAGNANNLADMAAALQSAQLKWTNGNSQPVGDTLKVDDNTHHYSLEVKIGQAPE
jgi:hypothetical protein